MRVSELVEIGQKSKRKVSEKQRTCVFTGKIVSVFSGLNFFSVLFAKFNAKIDRNFENQDYC